MRGEDGIRGSGREKPKKKQVKIRRTLPRITEKISRRTNASRKTKVLKAALKRTLVSQKSVLEEAAIGRKSTRRRYRQLLASFSEFAQAFGAPLTGKPPTTDTGGDALDSAAVEWADESFFEGYPSSYGETFFCALKDHWPGVGVLSHLQLPRFRRARKGWGKLAPGTTRQPFSWLHVVLIAHSMVLKKEVEAALFIITLFST